MSKTSSDWAYGDLIAQFIEDQYVQERLDDPEYIEDYLKPEWLDNALAKTLICQEENGWMVYLLLVHPLEPEVFIKIPLKHCQTKRIAQIVGRYYQATRSSDLGIALELDIEDMGCSWN